MKKFNILICLMLFLFALTGCSGKNNTENDSQQETEGITRSVSNTVESEDLDSDKTLAITYFNTGKSDCMMISLNDFCMVIDTADADDADMFQATMNQLGISQIDYLVLSHLDSDHIGGAAGFIKKYPIANIIQPEYIRESTEFTEYNNALSEGSYSPTMLHETMQFTVNGADITIIPPKETEYDNSNNYSIIVKVVYGEHSFLFMGDSQEERLTEYLESNPTPVTVLKVPHHGFYNGKQEELIHSVKPVYAVVTNASESAAGSKVLQALDDVGAKTYFTCNGTITVKSDGTSLYVIQ